MKTANELAIEYWDKPPIERVNNTLQDYVFDYQQNKIDDIKSKVRDLWTELDERNSKDYIFSQCNKIICEILND